MDKSKTSSTCSPYDVLVDQGLADPVDLQTVYHPRTRDRKDVQVHQAFTGALFLSETVEHDYSSKGKKYFGASASVLSNDTVRRRDELRDVFDREELKDIVNVRSRLLSWVDVGCGTGSVLAAMKEYQIGRGRGWLRFGKVEGVEPNDYARKHVPEMIGIHVHESLDQVDGVVDIMTMFHVLEHHPDPITFLKTARKKCKTLIVEVPHARDFLIHQDIKGFRDFTFWSEHLILHTEETLIGFLKEAGFQKIKVTGVQRYGLANHMHWMQYGKPGGHKNPFPYDLEREYTKMLQSRNMTDTLWAVAS